MGTPKPGWTPYTYPHPLRTAGGGLDRGRRPHPHRQPPDGTAIGSGESLNVFDHKNRAAQAFSTSGPCVSAIQSQALKRTLCVSNTKFHVWEGEKLRGHLYSSDYKELSIADEQKICKHLEISFELAWFPMTREIIYSLQLPQRPTFTNDAGRKFWL
jgi:hypothetical protein